MEINNEARPIYDKYMSRTNLPAYGNDKPRENPNTRSILNAIFESAAGPDKTLSNEEASAVETFLKDSGVNLDQISYTKVEALSNQWVKNADKYLPSITTYDEISQGFSQLLESMNSIKNNDDSNQNEAVMLKQAVFFNRIIKGKNSIAQNRNTTAMIRQNVDIIGQTVTDPKNSINLGTLMRSCQFCLSLLSATTQDQGECEALRNGFIGKFLPNNQFFHKTI